MKILVIQKKLMGDVLICSVVFKRLREKFPHARLHYLIDEKYLPVVEHHPYIDRFIFFEDRFSDTIKAVRKQKYSIVIDTYSKVGTALIAFLSGAEQRISYHKPYTKYFYTHPVHRRTVAQNPLTTTTIEHRLQLLEPLGIEFKITKPEIFLTDAEQNEGKKLAEKYAPGNQKKVMLSTFGSSADKTYPLQYMKEVIEEIAEAEVKIFCNYLPDQKAQFEALYRSLSGKSKDSISIEFDTENLREYISVLNECDALIGNEGGSTNISKAVNVPTFTIFSPQVAKKSWNWFDDGVKNVSVHLHDYLPESSDYEDFSPRFFTGKLRNFISTNLK